MSMRQVVSLSLDGGGLLALSELYMLQETMHRLQSVLDLETVPLPCDHFDVIGGSGSGGLIAILIGRLHLTVDQAIESFLELHRPLYDRNHSTTTRSDSFKRSVQTLVQTFIPNRDENTVMMENDPKCKVFVCTMPSASMGGRPECFRNYRARKFRSHDCHIWEAARATTAYRMLFEPIRIGPRLARETYVDPSLGHNNPIEFVVEETKALFNDPNDKFLFLSLGAGHPGILPSPPTEDGWAHFFKRLARDCEQTANRMEKDPGSGHARFNVSQGLQGVSVEEFIDPGLIASHTKQYLGLADVDRRIDDIVALLVRRSSPFDEPPDLGLIQPQPLLALRGGCLYSASQDAHSNMTTPQPPPVSSEPTISKPDEQNQEKRAEPEVREQLTQDEMARQKVISELINGEAAYVNDLENIGSMYIQPLVDANPPIISKPSLREFISDVFNNYTDLYQHHLRFLNKLHKIQREQHLVIRSISALVLDAVLQFREAYLEYIPNCPIATWRINNEMRNNPSFRAFVDQCTSHPNARRLDMQHFISLPISRLSRYEQLLKLIHEKTPPGHDDRLAIPDILELIRDVQTKTEPSVASARQKVELWQYNERLVFKPGEGVDMNLLDENRSLIFSGRVLSRPDDGSPWSEVFVILFDNYLVITNPVQKDEVTEYQVYRRPIPLDLLAIINASDPPTRLPDLRRGISVDSHQFSRPNPHPLSRHVSAPYTSSTSHHVYPFTLHQSGRFGRVHPLFVESAAARAEWSRKLGEALTLRKVFQETNKVFGVKTLSIDTFLLPNTRRGPEGSVNGSGHARQPSYPGSYAGRITCAVPLASVGGRALVAVGCQEGIWIGFKNDPKSMKQVLHLKMVTQCAVLEDSGIFLVLADKALLAYQIEALVPSNPHAPQVSQVPQKLSGTRDVHFFRVGKVKDRTFVIYMHKKLSDSTFRVLEPVMSAIIEGRRQPAGFRSKLGLKPSTMEWFRTYKEFSLSLEAYDLIFLKGKIVIMYSKGFEIMNIDDSDSMTVPQRDDPRVAHLKARCQQCRPIAMYCATQEVFLLCFTEFGVFVDKHGKPTTGIVIEWEGRAERATQYSGYILLFSPSFIEIRSLKTGGLIQFIDGDNIRCIWDGRGASDNFEVNGARSVHAVANAPEMASVGGLPPPVSQHVFELIPILPDKPRR